MKSQPAKNNFQLTIAWLYPDLMSTYGDRGNIEVLVKRCMGRNVDAEVIRINIDSENNNLKQCDLIFMGGAQDRQQKLVGKDFITNKGPVIKEMLDRRIPALFVCAAYQFAGNYYLPYQGEKIKGAGIFDLTTSHPGDQAKRLIGNVAGDIADQYKMEGLNYKNTIIGFENHGGRTYLGKDLKPFARVIKGFGNNGEDGFEGAVYKNAIGSYFHGPILPKNPHIADWLIAKAMGVKYRKKIILKQLDDTLEWQAHNFMLKRLKVISSQ